MTERTANYPQDRLGNENRELDQLRAQEGMTGADDDDSGIEEIGTADTGSNVLVYSIPTHADQVVLDLIHAHNSAASEGTFQVFEASLDSNGAIGSTTRRSVPINVSDGVTRAIGYEGEPFTRSIAVNSEFAGQIGVAVISDHKQSSESASEQTSS